MKYVEAPDIPETEVMINVRNVAMSKQNKFYLPREQRAVLKVTLLSRCEIRTITSRH